MTSKGSDANLKAYILCRFADRSPIYNTWMADCPIPCVVVDDYLPTWQVPADAGIVITHMHYRWEEIHALRKIFQASAVPVLVLADGILEYRNTWEHPELADGSMFQPLIGHKIACLGRGQARILESWGNPGRAEVVGLPRLDDVLQQEPAPINREGPFRLLVATANTPAFDEAQRDTVIESLDRVKQQLSAIDSINDRAVQICWRLTDNLEQSIGLPILEEAEGEQEERPSLAAEIDAADAVITTPSTLFLESALRRRPTAILDFHNTPQFVPAAWTIHGPQHIDTILGELADPPLPKMLFQETSLHDNLQCREPAKPRLLKLVETMVELGQQARSHGRPLQFPQRIVDDPDQGFTSVEASFDMANLFPGNDAFQTEDNQQLQAELSQLVKRLDTLPQDLVEKNQYIAQLLQQRDEMKLRITDLRQRIMKLRRILGIQPKK
ncbi:MAG: hypothetical protein MK108_06510 [Mariniblastus sp.]|nr:hypothetical protein [Mariniblastus sp.]